MKRFGISLVQATLVVVLALLPWPTDSDLTGRMRTLAMRSQETILLMPSVIVYSMIESAVSLAVGQNLDPELLEIEAYWQTPAEQI